MKILGMHYCLPPTEFKVEELNFPERVTRRTKEMTGIEKVRVDGDVTRMGYYAAKHLLTSVLPIITASIDCVIFVSQTAPERIPPRACVLQDLLCLHADTMAFDLSMGCSAFPYATEIGTSLIKSGAASRVLIVFSDAITNYLDPQNHGLTLVHGDGAAAMVLTDTLDGRGSIETALGTSGEFSEAIRLDGEGTVTMDGPTVAHFAIRSVPRIVEEYLNRDLQTADLVLIHQANKTLVTSIYDKLEVPEHKRFFFVKDIGNTASACTPILLAEALRQGRIKPGDKTVIVSFGNGMSWGTCRIIWPSSMVPVHGTVEQFELERTYGPWE